MVDNHFRVESNWEDEILKQAYRKETQGKLSCTHGSEEQVKPEPEPEPEIKDKQRKTQDSYIDESHRHEEGITQTEMDNITTGDIEESHGPIEEGMCQDIEEKETNKDTDKQEAGGCLMANGLRYIVPFCP